MGNFFTDLFSTKPAEEAAKAKAQGFTNARTDATAALDTGLSAATPLYGQAYGDFSTLGAKFGAGHDAYNDATGVNGQPGLDKARATFTSLPGYQEGIDMALNKNDRLAASRGILASGNTIADTTKLATDYASQHYNDYLASLAPNLAGATSATAGGAGVLGAEAGADLGVASQKATTNYNAATGIGGANADAALAPYSASSNFWSALTGLGGLALKATGVGGFAAPTRAAA